MPPALLTVPEAAVKLRVNAATARRYCETGALRATKAGRDWLIRERDLARFTQPTRGRPRGSRKATAQT